MANASNVKLGVCNLIFNGKDLGYTQGGVKVTYKADIVEKSVDQVDAPIGETIKNQTFSVEVPMAEYDLARLADLLPGATLITDAGDPTKKKLSLSGESGIDLYAKKAKLVINPIGGTAADTIVIHNAVPDAQLDFSFTKDNVRVYKVTFKALADTSGFVSFGDPTVYKVISLRSISGKITDPVVIFGTGFVVGGTKPSITFGAVAVDAADITITSDTTITIAELGATTPTGLVDVVVTQTQGGTQVDTLTDAYTVLA